MGNKPQRKWTAVAGAVLLCMAVIFIVFFFGEVSTAKFDSVFLFPTPEYETDWRYYDEAGNAGYEAHQEDGYLVEVEGTVGNAVAAERVMKEPLENAALKFQYLNRQISVYLDGTLLYSDIPGTPEQGVEFLPPDAEFFQKNRDAFKTQYVTLPDDYLGGTLTVVTYFADDIPMVPAYPTMQNDDTVASYPVVDSARPLALSGVFAAAAVLLLVLLVYAVLSGIPDWPVALLAAFFLCAMIGQVYTSTAAYYSIGTNLAGYLVSALYADLLLLFFSCYMRKGFRIAMLCAVAFHAAATILQALDNAWAGEFYEAGNEGWVAFDTLMLFAALCFFEWRAKKPVFAALGKYIAAFGAGYAALLACAFFFAPDSVFAEDVWRPFSSFVSGRAVAFNNIFSICLSIAGLVIIFLDFIRRNISVRTERNMLALKNETVLENMRGMEAYMRRADEQRHEIRHHIAALRILLKNGEEQKAQAYLEELSEAVDASGLRRYTENMLVSAILNGEASKAARSHVEIDAELGVPQELSLSDNDLCSLLYNMLDNAIRACAELPEGRERRIRFKMQKKGNFLVIVCRNPKAETIRTDAEGHIATSKRNAAGHGYGLSVMRKICEKYHSVLLIEIDDEFFTVRTNLRLPD